MRLPVIQRADSAADSGIALGPQLTSYLKTNPSGRLWLGSARPQVLDHRALEFCLLWLMFMYCFSFAAPDAVVLSGGNFVEAKERKKENRQPKGGVGEPQLLFGGM